MSDLVYQNKLKRICTFANNEVRYVIVPGQESVANDQYQRYPSIGVKGRRPCNRQFKQQIFGKLKTGITATIA